MPQAEELGFLVDDAREGVRGARRALEPRAPIEDEAAVMKRVLPGPNPNPIIGKRRRSGRARSLARLEAAVRAPQARASTPSARGIASLASSTS